MAKISKAYPGPRNNINTIFSMVECLYHGDEGGSGIAFLVYACQVVVHLNNTLKSTFETLNIS